MSKIITEEEKELLCALKREGKTNKEIADITGRSIPAIQKITQGISKAKNAEEEIIKRRLANESMRDIAAALGLSYHQVEYVSKANGLDGKRSTKKPDYAKISEANKGEIKSASEVAAFVEERTPLFIYVGGYTSGDGEVTIKCKICGAECTRSMVTIRHRKLNCPNCTAINIAKTKAEKEKAKAEAKAIAAKIKAEERAKAKAEADEQRALLRESRKRTIKCAECGTAFVTYSKSAVCCSRKCSRKRANNHKDRRIAKDIVVDKNISVRSLYNRDNGVCHICGGLCDWADKTERNGTIICGDNYPSIDHVVPITHGGLHAWGNVRLAHRHCNTIKSNNYFEKKRGGYVQLSLI